MRIDFILSLQGVPKTSLTRLKVAPCAFGHTRASSPSSAPQAFLSFPPASRHQELRVGELSGKVRRDHGRHIAGHKRDEVDARGRHHAGHGPGDGTADQHRDFELEQSGYAVWGKRFAKRASRARGFPSAVHRNDEEALGSLEYG